MRELPLRMLYNTHILNKSELKENELIKHILYYK